ncbi:MAG TPA: DUF2889 domain-containing protein [Acidimicrobiales bacterium]
MSHVAHFLAEPLTDLPPRRSTTLRRTQNVDMVGRLGAQLELIGHVEDHDATTASCHAVLDAERTLTSLSVTPELDTAPLLGLLVGRGFRAEADKLVRHGGLRSALLTELPVAAFLAGYGNLYVGSMPGPLSENFLAGMPVDICAGWESSGTMVQLTHVDRMVPTPDGPPAPLGIDTEWHDMAPLEPGHMRRQRLIQRDGDEAWAMFRDTYARPDGQVIVLHEYSADIRLEPLPTGGPGFRIASCAATPRVLPWPECPSAAASAQRIEGHAVAELRGLVKDEFLGTSICTHLNDLLGSLVQLDDLV